MLSDLRFALRTLAKTPGFIVGEFALTSMLAEPIRW
jgi:hypothetical protein